MNTGSLDGDLPDRPELPAPKPHASGRIKYRIEYISSVTPGEASMEDEEEVTATPEQLTVMEYVEVRHTKEAFASEPGKQRAPRKYHEHFKGTSYITILSTAVNEALRCVVDYYPNVYGFLVFILRLWSWSERPCYPASNQNSGPWSTEHAHYSEAESSCLSILHFG